MRARLRAIAEEREQLQAELERGDDKLQAGAAVMRQALELLENPQELYRQAGPTVRRGLNQAFFDKLYIDGPSITGEELAQPFDAILFLRARRTYSRKRQRSALSGAPLSRMTSADLLATALAGVGSSKAAMVEVAGIEPASFGCVTGLLRAQPAVLFSAPAVTQASCRRAQLLLGVPIAPAAGSIG